MTNITDRDGLSQNTVRYMMQDSKGFLWMGFLRLNRYDGNEFKVVYPQNELSTSFSDGRIRKITEDRNGYIWIYALYNTMYCYDPNLETFIDYDPSGDSKNFSHLLELSNGDIWLWGNDQGCCRIKHVDGKLQSWRLDEKELGSRTALFVSGDSQHRVWIGAGEELFMVEGEEVISMYQGTKFHSVHEYGQQLFFVTSDKVMVFDKQRPTFLTETHFADHPLSIYGSCLLDDGTILIATPENIYAFDTKTMAVSPANKFFQGKQIRYAKFLTDNKGHIWVYNKSGILWRHLPDNRFEPLHLIPPQIMSLIDLERYEIYHDSRDIIWITTYGNGLFALDLNSGQMHHYTSNKELPTNYLLCVTEDLSGEIWVGTEFSGAVKISLANYPVRVFYPSEEKIDDRSNAVRMIYMDSDGKYWFGARNGYLYVCDSSFRQLYSYQIPGGLPYTIAEDSSGYKWVGTKGKGLLIFPPDGKAPLQIFNINDEETPETSSNNIFTVLRDTKNRMWLSGFGDGLFLAERRGGELTFRQFKMKTDHQNMMRGMIQDRHGLIWIGSSDGVIVFDPDEIIQDDTKYTNLRYDRKDDRSLNNTEVKAVFEDSRGNIWFGTTGGGLNMLMREDTLERSWFRHYTAKNGLSNEVIQAIQEDDYGNIWVSTEGGISKFDLKTERFENFIFSDDPQGNFFNEQSRWKNKNGELMFGSYNGVYIFDPSTISFNSYTPPVVMTGLRINGNSVFPGGQDSPLSESITSTQKIVLKHNRNSFNFEYTMLNFRAPESNQYTYYLEGYEDDWNPISRYNFATYRNVPPGAYQFKVKGSNSFGIWNEYPTVLEVIILPPWWKSTWAIILYVIALAAIIYFSSRLVIKIHRLNTAVEVEKQLTDYKLRFFTNISHEFRTPLTIIRGAIENLLGQYNLPQSTTKQVNVLAKSSNRLLRLVDQLLEFRRLQNNRLELKLRETEAVGFFYDIYSTFREMAEKKQIEFLFESNEQEHEMLLDRGHMDKIAYNLLSNAFKNTPVGGKIVMQLTFSTADDRFTLSVSDSGPGVPKDQRDKLFVRFNQINHTTDGTGVGLHLTSELATIHKGSIAYTDSDLGGACFTLSIPLSDKSYNPTDIVHEPLPKNMAATIENTQGMDAGMAEASVGKPFRDYKLVVIEDNDDIREFLQGQLGEYFTVASAIDGTEGLEKVMDEQPDLVICDVMMPGMDGFELTRRLKTGFETSHIPVILLTAHSSEEYQLEGIQAGADAYIAKPFSMKYLMARIVKLIEQREKLQQKFAKEPGLVQPSINFSGKDKLLLNNLHDAIEKNIGNVDFSLEIMARELGLSRTNLFKKVKGLTGYPPNEYLRVIRMKKAAELLATTTLNISEISYRVGINDPFYFSRCFKSQFGKSPTQYQKELH